MSSRLFGVDNCLVNGVPTLGIQTPVLRGVLVAGNSDFSSLDFFVSIDSHSSGIFIVCFALLMFSNTLFW